MRAIAMSMQDGGAVCHKGFFIVPIATQRLQPAQAQVRVQVTRVEFDPNDDIRIPCIFVTIVCDWRFAASQTTRACGPLASFGRELYGV